MTPTEKLPIMKRFLLSNRPMPKNFVNTIVGAELKAFVYPDLNTAIEELKLELGNIEKFFDANPDEKPMNPTFGPLNFEEWKHFHIKHFEHHLRQFGLLEEEK